MTFAEYCEELYGQKLAPFQKELCNAWEENYKRNGGKIVIKQPPGRGQSASNLIHQMFLFSLYEEEMKKCKEEKND